MRVNSLIEYTYNCVIFQQKGQSYCASKGPNQQSGSASKKNLHQEATLKP